MSSGDSKLASNFAAVYVRMSTEHQQYSTSNQMDVIREYAKRRGLEIVKEYSDEGKSGLNIAGRDSLARMIKDVQSGDVTFSSILVYDITRRTELHARRRQRRCKLSADLAGRKVGTVNVDVDETVLQILHLGSGQRDRKITDLSERQTDERRGADTGRRRTVNMGHGLAARKSIERQREPRGFFIRAEQQRGGAGRAGVVGRRLLRAVQARRKQQTRLRLDLVDGAIRKRNEEQVSVRPGLNVARDAEVSADNEALALRLIEFIGIVGDTIREPRIGERKMLPVGVQLEPKQEAVQQRRARSADE